MPAPIPPTFERDRDPGDENPMAVLLELDVVVWRFDQLVAAGYDHEAANLIAEDATVDLHQACDLLGRGATAQEALRILL